MIQSTHASASVEPDQQISIGTLSRETGIEVETLRMWERRYGAPTANRLPSGHRRYEWREVERLRLVREALRRGSRPREVVPLGAGDLRAMLGSDEPDGSPREKALLLSPLGDTLMQWWKATLDMDGVALMRSFREEWRSMPVLPFLEHLVLPYLQHIGDCWRAGEVSVAQEHIASESLSDFLNAQWREMNEKSHASPVLLASLPNDLHRFGLIMCATLVADTGHRVIQVGSHTPPQEIVTAAQHLRPQAVVISVSNTTSHPMTRRWIKEVRQGLTGALPLAIGGSGAPKGLRGVERLNTLAQFHTWVSKLPR